MTVSTATASEVLAFIDPLEYLPSSKVLQFPKGQTIYSPDQPSTGIYLVVDGKVRVSRLAHSGRQVLVDMYRPDEFFGESAFAGQLNRIDFAVAHENANVMTWTVNEIEDIAARRPQLAIGLLQFVVVRSRDFICQIESFATEDIPRRLARALIRFSERFGKQTEDGAAHMMALSHQLLSEYVGTSREIVTHYLNQFRRHGYLDYSRKGIVLHANGMKEFLGGSPLDGSTHRNQEVALTNSEYK